VSAKSSPAKRASRVTVRVSTWATRTGVGSAPLLRAAAAWGSSPGPNSHNRAALITTARVARLRPTRSPRLGPWPFGWTGGLVGSVMANLSFEGPAARGTQQVQLGQTQGQGLARAVAVGKERLLTGIGHDQCVHQALVE